jgi:hypothetical protein
VVDLVNLDGWAELNLELIAPRKHRDGVDCPDAFACRENITVTARNDFLPDLNGFGFHDVK